MTLYDMNDTSSFNHFLPAFGAVIILMLQPSCSQAGPPAGHGMPAEAREQIHTLFENHDKIRREVTKTEDGYVAVTESDDAGVAKALQKHVAQMEERLESGLMVRRWDPAFEQYVSHYKAMEHTFEATDKGVRMVVKGRTALAAKVAQNHAAVISDFVAHGWTEHDVKHPAVAD